MSEALELSTARKDLMLRELVTPEDDRAYFDAVESCRPHLSQHGDGISDKYPTLEHVTQRRLTAGNDLRLGIWHEDEGFVGSINTRPNESDTETEIGFWLEQSATGKGYATTAFVALLDHIRNKYDRIYAEIHPDNQASMKVVRWAGFVAFDEVERDWGPAIVFESLY